jgi:chemotaxis protein MotB
MQPAMGLALAALMISTASCVSERRFNDEVTRAQQCEEERARLKSETIDLQAKMAELGADLDQARKRLAALQGDTSVMGTSLRKLTTNYDKLNETYERMLSQVERLREGSMADARKLNDQLDATRTDLQRREEEVRKLELALAKKEGNLEQLGRSLSQREARVKELEGILARKDSAVVALKDKVAAALMGFRDQGLTVEQRNGKVYVSMDEKLLFASGSWVVDAKGSEALKKLAKVLETQSGVNILVEGHTDNVPYKGTAQVKDNWDLSVMRATAIVRTLLTGSSLSTGQLTAAGRGEYMPIAPNDTPEGRARNRRSEVIITPKLDELFRILERN